MKHIIAPLVAVLGFAGLSLAGELARTNDVNVVFRCTYAVAQEDSPPADILILGNSQAGAAIDTLYLEDLLAEQTGRRISITKLPMTGSSPVPTRMLVRRYLAHRGAPDLVLMQPQFQRQDADAKTPGAPIHLSDAMGHASWSDLLALREDVVHDTGASPLPYWARAGYRNELRLLTDRTVANIAGILSASRTRGQREFCDSEERYRLAGNWPYGDLPLQPGDLVGPILDDAGRAHWKDRMARRAMLDLSSPERTFEIDQNRKLITELESAGTHVVLMTFPSLEREASDARETDEFAQLFEREMMSVDSILTPSERAHLGRSFRDPVHVNFEGAQIITQALARKLADTHIDAHVPASTSTIAHRRP